MSRSEVDPAALSTVIEIADAVRTRRVRAVDVLDLWLARNADDPLNAWVVRDVDLARRAAEAVDSVVARGDDPGPFAGVPIGVKDLEDCAGLPTGHGSLAFSGRPPVEADSIHTARLRAAGAVPVGKTTAPEFGTLNFTRNKATGVTRNPWAIDCTPGGSSGGSAALVAAGRLPAATASDGGGSTRIPAAFSGLVGMKPSHGRIPNVNPSPSQTSVKGLLVTTVSEAARHLDVTAGPHDLDRLSLPAPVVSYVEAVEHLDVSGLRARWSEDLGFAAVDPEVAAIAESAAMALVAAAGLRLDRAPVSLTDPVRAWQSQGAMDLWLDLEQGMWPRVADDLTRYVRGVLEQTEAYPVSRFASSFRRRQRLDADLAGLFAEIDVLITPTTAVPAFAAAGPPPSEIAGRTVHPAMSVPFTMLANLGWQPALSVPAGLTADGRPVGLQITARRHADEVVLRLGRLFEQARPWPRTAPGWPVGPA